MGPMAPSSSNGPRHRQKKSLLPTPAWLALVVVAALGGCLLGRSLPAADGMLAGATTVTEEQLDDPMATYVLGGATGVVTVRDAIAQQSSLEGTKNDDGTYEMPSVESAVAAARMQVLLREVEKRGITVGEDELTAYAADAFGTDDLASLAVNFGMDDATLQDRLREGALMARLRAEVVEEPGDVPTEPAKPSEDAWSTPTAEYAAYVIALAGDEWDADTGTWAADDGPFATALHDFDVQSDAATYDAALTAYRVAYQLKDAADKSADAQWTAFVNDLLCEARFTVCTLGS